MRVVETVCACVSNSFDVFDISRIMCVALLLCVVETVFVQCCRTCVCPIL